MESPYDSENSLKWVKILKITSWRQDAIVRLPEKLVFSFPSIQDTCLDSRPVTHNVMDTGWELVSKIRSTLQFVGIKLSITLWYSDLYAITRISNMHHWRWNGKKTPNTMTSNYLFSVVNRSIRYNITISYVMKENQNQRKKPPHFETQMTVETNKNAKFHFLKLDVGSYTNSNIRTVCHTHILILIRKCVTFWKRVCILGYSIILWMSFFVEFSNEFYPFRMPFDI